MTEIPSSEKLQRLLDQCRSTLMLSKQHAFLSSLMCMLRQEWDDSIPTAATDYKSIFWSRQFFMRLSDAARVTVQAHEVWHVARLHNVRRGSRDPRTWNQACDYRINNDLHAMGFSFVGLEGCCLDPQRFPPDMAEEDIYSVLMKDPPPPDDGSDPFAGDMIESGDTPAEQTATIMRVAAAMQQAKMLGDAGAIPGSVKAIIDRFLNPAVPWEQLLQRWFIDLAGEEHSWSKRNRRYQDVYLPSLVPDLNRLGLLHYYFDISGSVTDEMIARFNGEVRYIKNTFNPEKLVLVTFDTEIHDVIEITEDDEFDRLEVTGRGGTSLKCVREHIIKTKPTAAIIFTDLECRPMEPLPVDVPIIWTVVDNPGATVPFGTLIHVKEPT